MDMKETINLIKALVNTSEPGYTVNQLKKDFEDETGIKIPKCGFGSVSKFLRSLTNAIKIYGEPPNEYVELVKSEKSSHITSLLQRQRLSSKFKSDHPKRKEIRDKDSLMKCQRRDSWKEFKENELAQVNRPQVKAKHKADSNNDSNIPEGVKNKLKQLISNDNGIWCCDLLDLYYKHFKTPLEFEEYGYRSLMEMVQKLGDVFRYVRPGNGDWLLFDATKPPSEEEKKLYEDLQKMKDQNICKVTKSQIRNALSSPIDLGELLIPYIVERCGIADVDSIATSINESTWEVYKERGKWMLKRRREYSAVPTYTGEDKLVLTPNDDFFADLFPEDVVPLSGHYPEMSAEEKFQIGEKVEINVGEVWSPARFYVQLKEYESSMNMLMDELQTFYNNNGDKYKMPEATICQNQVCTCVCRDSKGVGEWERTIIANVVDQDRVKVKYVDYGSMATVPKTSLRFLHQDFLKLPVQGFQAAVVNIKPLNGEKWSDKANNRFLDLVSKSPVVFHVVDRDNEKLYGEILNLKTNLNISDILVKERHAVYSNPTIDDNNVENAEETSPSDKEPNEKAEKGLDNSSKSEVEKRAFAFNLLCNDITLQNVAKFNLETGLRVALCKAVWDNEHLL